MAVSLTETVVIPPGSSPISRRGNGAAAAAVRPPRMPPSSSVAYRSSRLTPRSPEMRVRIDPQQALQPARKKLSTLEAQRVMGVLSAAIRRAELATSLPRLAAAQRRSEGTDWNATLGDDLARLVETYGVVMDSHCQLSGLPAAVDAAAVSDDREEDGRVVESRNQSADGSESVRNKVGSNS